MSTTTPNHDQNIQRALFDSMIRIGIEVEVCMKIMAFWIWLESQGFEDIITNISDHDDKFLALLSAKTEQLVLSSLHSHLSPNLVCRLNNTQNFSFLVKEKVLSKEITGIYKSIHDQMGGTKDEEEILEKVITYWVSCFCEQKEQLIGAFNFLRTDINNIVGSNLNPFAKEWNPTSERAPEEDRCLFLTFSNGYPLTENQITRFFTREYGPYVERVYVHWPEPRNHKVPPLFGKVVFKVSCIPAMILGEGNETKFWVDTKPLWCKRFEPNKKIARSY